MSAEAMENDASIDRRTVCAAYLPAPGAYDEMFHDNGTVRRHWQPFLTALNRMGCGDLERCRQEVMRILRENGIAYNIHGSAQGVHRNWRLDIIPLLFSREEWAAVEAGLRQRARLLDMVLSDLYGPMRIVREGLLPMELIYRHEGFLRACHGLRPGGYPRLSLYSVDLARSSAGRICALGDFSQRPIGLGYALENRTAMAKVLPDFFRECRILRLSDFFRTLRAEMIAASPHQADQPRIVLLSPGPRDEFYFEQAYLAAYLGYPLVQGDDLTVRDGYVWLKSLAGLQRVDVILRQIEDPDTDPLELRQESRSGVAGLLEAVRRGNVAILNPPGTGVLDNPGLMSFLPEIARRLLGEELKLPSVATWWCGEPSARKYVLEHIDRLIIKTIHRSPRNAPVYGTLMSRAERDEWRARIQENPHRYVGQEQLRFSTSPALSENHFIPLHTVFRGFAVARQEGEYEVMPGGIARSAGDRTSDVVSNRTGGMIRDAWVIASQPQKHVSLWLQKARMDRSFTRISVLPSRAAENLFWVGRYAERTEALARVLRTTFRYLIERDWVDDDANGQFFMHLLQSLNTMSLRPPAAFTGGEAPPGVWLEAEVSRVVHDGENAGSLTSILQFMLNAAYAVRDHWSIDTWHVINSLEEHRHTLEQYTGYVARMTNEQIDRLITSLLAFMGLCMESMSREHGWLLLDIGRRIERSLMFIELTTSSLVPGFDPAMGNRVMEAVLISTENVITYRRRYRSYMELETVLDLLLLDDRNPRSLIYQLDRLQEHIALLPRESQKYRLSEEEQLILKATSRLRLSNTARLSEPAVGSRRHGRLESLLGNLHKLLAQTSEAISQIYFSHIREDQQTVSTPEEGAP
ncbi:circularly permuted type 2 ATP-grasp protein [Desulfococcus sp.]|uniref:circularly permuted type 2 ATP-grasp protein n=1 Tax=Desulfococcus sp. TaxID=2025834 RepID=UPI0035939D90